MRGGDNNRDVYLDPTNVKDDVDILRAHRSREKRYAFDRVFEPEEETAVVYAHTTKSLIQGVLDGFNATVFAYGQVGRRSTAP